MVRTYALVSLRLTLLAAIGVSSTACGGKEVGGNPAGGSAGTSGTGGTAGSGGSNRHCPNAVPIMQPSGKPSGFVLCEDGTKNRVSKEICDTVTSLEACRGDEQSTVNCLTDSDCTDKPYGKCVSLSAEGFESDYCGCVYACSTDSDCKGNDVCVCAGVAGASHCAGSSCTINDDCVSNECSVSVYDNGCNETTTLHCRAADDACRTDADCTEPNRNQCAVDDGSQDFSCLGTSCAIGRPLMVDGSVRATRSKSRDDWRDRNMTPDLTTMQPEVMEALANRWADIAAMEHASVASFARFTLQLMALGAPADLLGETQQAAADEVEHARKAYAVASAYAGKPLGPASLDLTNVRIDTDRKTIIRGLIEEACVGEAIGVAEALAYADAAEDPAIVALLSQMVEEEQKHASLAWRTLRWLLNGADKETIAIARESFEKAAEEMRKEPTITGPIAPEHGLWSASQIAFLRRRALREVVNPCARALLDEIQPN